MRLRNSILVVIVLSFWASNVKSEASCDGPHEVCGFVSYVLKLKVGRRLGNAVYIGPGWAVTNRHIILLSEDTFVETKTGERYSVEIMPSGYKGDLALLRVKDLNLGPPPSFIDHFSVGTPLFVIAHRGLTGQPTVYPPGIVLLPPAEGHALARLHHDASGGDGSDGGAVLTEDGRLAGIATVGNVRRSEAIPAAQIRALIKEADASFMQRYEELGAAYTRCNVVRKKLPKRRVRLARRAIAYLIENCGATRNGHLIEDAARILGRAGHLTEARDLFNQVLSLDPHALGARLGLVVTLLLGGGHIETLPHLKWMIKVLPRDFEVLRLSIQAGKYSGDLEFAEAAYSRLQRLNPALALPMRKFLDGFALPRRAR